MFTAYSDVFYSDIVKVQMKHYHNFQKKMKKKLFRDIILPYSF